MRFLSIAAGVVFGAACTAGVAADPARLLAPDDPTYRSGWHPPPLITAGLRPYRPVAARNWLDLEKGGRSGGTMPDMPGMGARSRMQDMPGMEGGK